MTPERTAVLSVDCELFGHTPAYRAARGVDGAEGLVGAGATAGIEGVEFLLGAFAEHGIRSTWFVVSGLADTHPGLVERVADAGHEVGSHTRTHRLLSDLSSDGRREELAGSRRRLREATGSPVGGFRAPAFDTPPGHFGAVREAGYDYDASVVPSRRIPGWYGGEHRLQTPAPAAGFEAGAPGDLTVVPASVMPGVRLPLSGFWLRLFGRRWARLGMALLARRGITPVLYVHPWEFVDLPAVEGLPRRVRYRTGAWMRRTVRQLLAGSFRFTAIGALLEGPESAGAARHVGAGR